MLKVELENALINVIVRNPDTTGLLKFVTNNELLKLWLCEVADSISINPAWI